jgi:hypothetical protein
MGTDKRHTDMAITDRTHTVHIGDTTAAGNVNGAKNSGVGVRLNVGAPV